MPPMKTTLKITAKAPSRLASGSTQIKNTCADKLQVKSVKIR
jgi:hypothetical protein